MNRPRIRIVIEVYQPADFDRQDWQRYLVPKLHAAVGGELVLITTEEMGRVDTVAGYRRREKGD